MDIKPSIRLAFVLLALLLAVLIWSVLYSSPFIRPINVILDIFTLLIVFITTYTGVLRLFGFIKPKRYPKTENVTRFAVIACARNEEKVIAKLIESIKAQNYPREAYDIFIIADNCTDNTAGVARENGATVYERHDTEHIGKGYALGWFFERFNAEHADIYDAVAVFDADNLLDEDFLFEMNKALSAGECAAMGYRDSKNPYDNWIAGGTAIGFWNMVRFYYNSRSSVGLSALFGGTGYVFGTELVKEGWHTYTVTEDTEFSMLTIAKGKKIAFCHSAVFYDEQPTDLRISVRQRYRWSVGKQDCVKYCTRPLASAAFSKNFLLAFDGWMRILFPLAASLRVLLAVMEEGAYILSKLWSGAYISAIVEARVDPLALILAALGGALWMMAEAIIVIVMEKKPLRRMWKTVFMYPIHNAISAVLNIAALLYRDRTWRRIPHVRSLSVNDVKQK